MVVPNQAELSHDSTAHYHVPIDAAFEPFIEATLARLAGLHPTWRLLRDVEGITAQGPLSAAEARSAILYGLYQERIYAETLPMRTRLYRRLFG